MHLSNYFSKRYKEKLGRELPLYFANSHTVHLKKLKFNIIGSPGVREYRFAEEAGTRTRVVPEGKTVNVYVPPGLPAHTSEFIYTFLI
jgi:hypothetical protein